MARAALIIGTGEYGEALKPLPAAPKDAEAIAKILSDPNMGGFDQVTPLINASNSDMNETIETWFRERQKDDLALLYISGHGIRDAQLGLYFAAQNTRKQKEELIRSTAVAASFVRDCIRNSKAKRQVIILDCCFSGAFSDLLAKDEDSINLESLFGAEGRVVMTSSSSIQYSFEKREGGLSIYTHYLTEGIRTGAADLDNDGAISVQELHQYTSRKVQKESPAMTPKIIVLKDEGYRIQIAKAPLGDPRVKYRKEVEAILQEDGDDIDPIFSRPVLEEWQRKCQLSNDEVQIIEAEILEPIRQRQAKIDRYREVFTRAIQHKPFLGEREHKRLKQLQQVLGLLDENVIPIENEVIAQTNDNDLRSEKGIDYTLLRDLLQTGKWKEADQETYRLMITTVGKKEGQQLSREDLLNFPCEDLRTIDQLWVNYSHGKWGFSVQKHIWEECGSPIGYDEWKKFGDRVGWRKDGKWVGYDNLTFDPEKSLSGEFPGLVWLGFGWVVRWCLEGFGFLFCRAKTCDL